MTNDLFEHPGILHHILSLTREEVQSIGTTLIRRNKSSNLVEEVYFLLRKGFDPNTFIKTEHHEFIPTASCVDEMFKNSETICHCLSFIIDLFDDYNNFIQDAYLYFYLCGVNIDLPCQKGDSSTVRNKIKNKWPEFSTFEDVEGYSLSFITDKLDIIYPNRYGIDLEKKLLLVTDLSDEDRIRSIKMYSNTLVSHYTLEEAVLCYNLDLIANNKDIYVDQNLVKILMSNISNKSAYDSLLLLCNRLIKLSTHDVMNIPQLKRQQLVKVYKTPMYITNKYYKEILKCYFGENDTFDSCISRIKQDECVKSDIIAKYRLNNKERILLENTTMSDIILGVKPEIANETDMLSECVFDFPKECLFTERINNSIYVFTCSDIEHLKKDNTNPYTMCPLKSTVPLLDKKMPITDFIEEILTGKKFESYNINQIVQHVPFVLNFSDFNSRGINIMNIFGGLHDNDQ